MWQLVGQLIKWAVQKMFTTPGGAAATTGITISLANLRDQAAVIAGGSDIQALDEAARTAGRMLGLDGSEVLWPMDRLGNRIAPKYFHVDLTKGRAWYTAEYFSRKSVRVLGRRFGRRRFGFRSYANRMRRSP